MAGSRVARSWLRRWRTNTVSTASRCTGWVSWLAPAA